MKNKYLPWTFAILSTLSFLLIMPVSGWATNNQSAIIPFPISAQSITVLNNTPNDDANITEFAPTLYAMNISVPDGWLFGPAWLEIQYSNGASRLFVANSSQLGDIAQLNSTLSFNDTGQYAYRFNNQTGGVTDWVTFSVIPQATSGMNAYGLEVLTASEQTTPAIDNARATYTLNMRLLATDDQYYVVHLSCLGNNGTADWYFMTGNGGLTDESTFGPAVNSQSTSGGWFRLFANDVIIMSNTIFPFSISSEYPIYNGSLNFSITATSNNSNKEIDIPWPMEGRSSTIYSGVIDCVDSSIIDNPLPGAAYLASRVSNAAPPAWIPLTPIITVHCLHDLSNYAEYHSWSSDLGYQLNFPYLLAIPAQNCSWTLDSYGVGKTFQSLFGPNWFPIGSNITLNPYWNPIITTGIWMQSFNVYITAGNNRILLAGSNLHLGIKLQSAAPFGVVTTDTGFINLTSDSYSMPMGPAVGNISYYVWDSSGNLIGETDNVSPSNGTVVIQIPSAFSSHTVYFSAFSNDGLGVPTDTVALYIDGQRAEWGAVVVSSGIHQIKATDYFGIVQYQTSIDLSNVSEYPVYLDIATLSLYNNDTNLYLTFTIIKNDIPLLSQAIAPQNSLIFRFAVGLYLIEAYFPNGTLCGSEKLALLANQTASISFGIYSPSTLNFSAEDLIVPITTIDIIALIVVFGLTALFATLINHRLSSKSKSKSKTTGGKNR
jgi:hypothetical protein